MEKGKKFYIGLDLGTDSVGWAASDENYRILKARGHSLWGSRTFPEASTAKDRRTFRSSRRREERRKERIDLLQDIFHGEIDKVDPAFFQRLNESSLHEDDKKIKCHFSLFNDKGYTDVQYYKDYPNIYFLRNSLINEDKKFDIRLVYLACHHLIKYRGNFLMEGQSLSNEGQNGGFQYIVDLVQKLQEFYQSRDENASFAISIPNPEKFSKDIVCSAGINDMTRCIAGDLSSNDEKLLKLLSKALAGGKVKASSLLPSEEEPEEDEKAFSFADASFDDVVLPELQTQYDSESSLFSILESLYNWIQFKKILKGETYLCTAMVKRYKKYGEDLQRLKKFCRSHFSKEEFQKIFIEPGTKELANYSAYTKGTLTGGRKRYSKACSYDEFAKFLKGELQSLVNENPAVANDPDYLYFINGFTEGSIFKKENSTDNGTLPYQLNELELKKILANQSKYYPFLNEKDNGVSNIEKIQMLLTFRIPYYVGPLNNHQPEGKNKHAWVVRKAEGKVTPWNFNEKVDSDKSEEQFISRMTSKCTFLVGEDVLPKCSLAYQEYMALNELNNLQINGKRLSVKLKNDIFDNLYKNNSKITLKKIKAYIVNSGLIDKSQDFILSGLAEEPKAYLSSYVFFKGVLGKIEYEDEPMIEEIIRWLTISEDKRRVELRIKNNPAYRKRLTDEQIKSISSFPCAGWGKFSLALLKGKDIGWEDPALGTWNNIIDLMHQTPLNFNELLYADQYGLLKQIDKHNAGLVKDSTKVTYEDVEDLNVSPTVRRPINQALRIVDEVVKASKKAPDKIFVEVTRNPDEKKNTKPSRKKFLLDLYNSIKNETEDFNRLKEELNNTDESRFKASKVYLYFTQMGRCMYTDEKIDFAQLDNNNIYDIDHIYPQSLIKDDSFDNRVLVSKKSNAAKTDVYPIDPQIQARRLGFWKELHSQKLITDEKFARLTRRDDLTDDEINTFVKRQLVTTSQSVKGLINLLERKYPKAKVIWAKASHASDFRKQFGFVKSRTVNDYHHAQDAYLNIVAGNVFDAKYSSFGNGTVMGYAALHKKDPGFVINPKYIFSRTIPGVWNTEGDKRDIDTVTKYMSHNDILFTTMPYEGKGSFYDMKLSPKNVGKNYGTVAEQGAKSDSSKYGGYDNIKTAYFFVVESDGKKGKRVRTIESMPIMYAKRFETDKEFAGKLLSDYFKLKNPMIICKKVLILTPLRKCNSLISLRGKTGGKISFANYYQWNASKDITAYVHILDKFKEDQMKKKIFDAKHPFDASINEYEVNENTNEKDTKKFVLSKKENIWLYQEIEEQLSKEIYDGISFGSVIPSLASKRDDFALLDIKSQVIVLFQMINLLGCNGATSDLSLIGLGTQMGKLGLTKTYDEGSLSIINQSVTGLYSKEQKI